MRNKNDLISKIFFSMLPVQVLIYAMGFINTIVDGVMAGRFIDAQTVGVVGLYFSMVNIFNAVGAVILGGTTVLCGRYMGRGDAQKTQGVFSLNITTTMITAALLTLMSLVIPGPIADILGANEALKPALMTYIRGYAIGIIPMLLSQQLASFLQMERQNARGYAGIAGMIISNVTLDIVLVGVIRMGIWGLALATALSNWIYFLILVPYYLTGKSSMRYDRTAIPWKELASLVKIGFPGALLIFCLSIRCIMLNRILLHYAGSDGLSAYAAFNMIAGLFIAYCVGNGNVVRMLISVFVGERDKKSMRRVLQIVFTKGMVLAVTLTAVVIILTPFLSGLFFPDRSSEVYRLTYQLFIIYALCIPFVLVAQVLTNYMQATGHNLFVNIMSVVDGLLSIVIPAAILAPVLGALGVWLSNPIGIVITILTVPIYALIYWKRVPKNLDEWMFIKPNFTVSDEDSLDIPIRSMDDVSETSAKIQEFCDAHDIAARPAYYASLCLEEMAGNVVRYGFTGDTKKHTLNATVVYFGDTVMLRLKDDCPAFNPNEMAEMVASKRNLDNIGIRTVYKIADEVTYQNMLGLNVLTINIKEENIAEMEANDYLLERRLKELDPMLHRIFLNTAATSQLILSKYKTLFPEYTDHSQFHSLTVIDSCNRLIGRAQIDKLNKDEVFVLLMACYLHDVGMGISDKDYEEFKDKLGADQYFKEHPNDDRADFVRTYHNDFSGLFIEKYADLFDLPSEEYVFAIKQVSRGHRKTDLYDESEYPSEYKMPDGNTLCLPYLAALVRLADEIDVAASRNPILLYDLDFISSEIGLIENKKLMAVNEVRMTRSSFVLYADTKEKKVYTALEKAVKKMQETLDLCRDVVEKRSRFTITQRKVVLRELNRDKE